MPNVDDVKQVTGVLEAALDSAVGDILPSLESSFVALLDAKDVEITKVSETADNLSAMITSLNNQIMDLRSQMDAAAAAVAHLTEINRTLSDQIVALQSKLAAATTPPAPVPVPSTPPAPVASGPFPTPQPQHAVLNPASGFFESTDGWQTDIFSLGFDVPGVAYGKTLVLEVLIQAAIDPKGKNVKIVRGWDSKQTSPNAGKCNLWVGSSPDGWQKVYVEGTAMTASQETQSFSFPSTKVRRERWEIKFPSAVGKSDGSIRRVIDGVQEFLKTGIPFDTVAAPGLQTRWFIQMDYSPNAGDTGPFKPTDWVKVKPVQVGVL